MIVRPDPDESGSWANADWQEWYVEMLFSDDVKGLGEWLNSQEVNPFKSHSLEQIEALRVAPAPNNWVLNFQQFCNNVFEVVSILHVSVFCFGIDSIYASVYFVLILNLMHYRIIWANLQRVKCQTKHSSKHNRRS